MRLALQALFGARDDKTQEGRKYCEKIERELRNNERSGNFLRKLRDAVADPRLRAPEIFADESFPDANVVAEYLDCQSESPQIRDEYERVCASSPEILAEVGCCYDVLMNRLDRPVDQPKNCRHRLYYIAWEDGRSSENNNLVQAQSQPDENLADVAVLNGAPKSKNSLRNTSEREHTKKKQRVSLDESDVQKTMRSQRCLSKKLGKVVTTGLLAASVLVLVGWGYSFWTTDSGSVTFETTNRIESSEEGMKDELEPYDVEEDMAYAQDDAYVNALVDDVITEEDSQNPSGFDDEVLQVEPLYVASNDPETYWQSNVHKQPNSGEKLEYGDEAIRDQDFETGKSSNKEGFSTDVLDQYEAENRPDLLPRESIVIPDRNNNVFEKRLRF